MKNQKILNKIWSIAKNNETYKSQEGCFEKEDDKIGNAVCKYWLEVINYTPFYFRIVNGMEFKLDIPEDEKELGKDFFRNDGTRVDYISYAHIQDISKILGVI